MGNGEQPASSGAKKRVIVLVHGIRTFAGWVPRVRKALEVEGFVVEPTNYGYLDAIRFLLPVPSLHNGPIAKVWDAIRTIRYQYPDAEINILAHSFGTYVVSNILQREFEFKANRIVFCGSIVDSQFPFNQVFSRATWPILNDVGSRDMWPALANSATWGYGSTGTYGFRNPLVRDRWQSGFTHSRFLEAEFCKRFWVPFFREGTIIEGDTEFEPPPFWIQLLSILKLKYLAALVVGFVVASLIWRYFCDPNPSFDCLTNVRPTDQAICEHCRLATKDRELDLLYRRLRDSQTGAPRVTLDQQQRIWWTNNRGTCGADVDCIAHDYDGRIAQLNAALNQLHANQGASH